MTQMPGVDFHIELWCRLLPEHTFNSGMAVGHLLYLQCISGAAAFLRCAYTHSGENAGQGCTVHTHTWHQNSQAPHAVLGMTDNIDTKHVFPGHNYIGRWIQFRLIKQVLSATELSPGLSS